ncbi:hypothetical protein MBN60_02300 [Candidatus Saccharibacteria bacterium]|nr:hypothetical protein [Candidatus Saccharibacteria bacterium]
MSEKQFTSQSNDKDDLTALVDAVYPKTEGITALMDAVFPTANNHDDTNTTPEDRANKKTTISPEKSTEENNKKPLTKIAVGALAAAMAIGGIVGLDKLTGRTASAEITIHNPEKAREQICDTQATLEESLGLPKSTSYDTFRGCDGTTDMVTKEGLNPGDEVEITVTTGAATAEKKKK